MCCTYSYDTSKSITSCQKLLCVYFIMQIHCTDQQKDAWFESDFYLSYIAILFTVDNGTFWPRNGQRICLSSLSPTRLFYYAHIKGLSTTKNMKVVEKLSVIEFISLSYKPETLTQNKQLPFLLKLIPICTVIVSHWSSYRAVVFTTDASLKPEI